MSSSLFSRKVLVINLVLSLLVFLFFTWSLRDNVPLHEDQHPIYAWIWAAFTAVCLSGVFWLASNMFSVVLLDERRRNKDESTEDTL